MTQNMQAQSFDLDSLLQQAILHREEGMYHEAALEIQKYLQVVPDSSQAYFELACINIAQANIERAQDLLDKSLLLQADNLEAFSKLGLVYALRQNYLKAIVLLQDALLRVDKKKEQDPDNNHYIILEDDIRYNLALAYCDSNDAWSAQKTCLESQERLEKSVMLQTALGRALREQGIGEGALHSYKKAYELYFKNEKLEGTDSTNNTNSIDNLASLDEADQKENVLKERVSKMNITGVEILCNLGIAYFDCGNKQSAEKYFQKAIELSPEDIEARYQYGLVHVYEDLQDPYMQWLILRYEKYIRKPDISSKPSENAEGDQKEKEAKNIYSEYEQARLCFALGKAYEDLKDYKNAFEAYQQGHNILKAPSHYSSELTQRNFIAIKNAFSNAEYIDELRSRIESHDARLMAEQKNEDTVFSSIQPIFIIGMPRSGTSLIEQILASHSKVHGAGECIYLNHAQFKTGPLSLPSYDHDFQKLSAEDLISMRCNYLNLLKRHNTNANALYITDKMPLNFRFIGMITLLFPQTKIIHCMRDYRDTCFSIFQRMFNSPMSFSHSLEDLRFYYDQYEELMRFWRASHSKWIYDCEYESLIAQPQKSIEELLAFCELDFEETCIKYHESNRQVTTASSLQVREPLHNTFIGKWQNFAPFLENLIKKKKINES